MVYVPNGVVMEQWTPDTAGTAFDVKPVMRPLAPYRERLTVLSGLANKHGDALPGEGAGDHARAAGAFLTGVHPKKTAGADIRAGISMDQIAARRVLARRRRSWRRSSCRSTRRSRSAPATPATVASTPTPSTG